MSLLRWTAAAVAAASVASPGLLAQDLPGRPNILWVTCEDMSPNLGCYGDAYAVTPNLDRFASQGVRYDHAFAPIGVCAPSRSTLILGLYASSVGTHHMRCGGTLPATVRCFPEYLRQAGYYCTNNSKTDYNFSAPLAAWDESGAQAHWRKRRSGQPFFSVFNIGTTHESATRSGGGPPRPGSHDPARAPVPPYHPDAVEVRRDWAKYADQITAMDRQAAALIREVEEAGLAKETIVFFFSDHGAGMPRSKRWLYDSGVRVPLIVRFPENHPSLAPGKPGTATDRLVSFVDFGPTVLSLAGIPAPSHLQGKAFLGAHAAPPRDYVYGFRDRMDERYDMLRSVRDKRYKYIRNYMPHLTYAQHIRYMYEMPTMKVWQRLADEGKLTGPQKIFFSPTKPAEELYDTSADPHEINNLADDPTRRPVIERMRAELRRWLLEIRDLGFLPEAELRTRFGKKPQHEAVRADPAAYPLERMLQVTDLGGRPDPESLPKLLDFMKDNDCAVRFWAILGILALGEKGGPAVDALVKALEDPAPVVRLAAADALSRRGRIDEALPILARELQKGTPGAQLYAINILDGLDGKAGPVLESLKEAATRGNSQYLRSVAEHALKAFD